MKDGKQAGNHENARFLPKCYGQGVSSQKPETSSNMLVTRDSGNPTTLK